MKNKKVMKTKVGIAHYKSSKSNFYVNGGCLLVYDKEVVLKCFIKEVVSFNRKALCVEVLPNHLKYKVIKMSDGKESYEVMLWEKNFEKLIQCTG